MMSREAMLLAQTQLGSIALQQVLVQMALQQQLASRAAGAVAMAAGGVISNLGPGQQPVTTELGAALGAGGCDCALLQAQLAEAQRARAAAEEALRRCQSGMPAQEALRAPQLGLGR